MNVIQRQNTPPAVRKLTSCARKNIWFTCVSFPTLTSFNTSAFPPSISRSPRISTFMPQISDIRLPTSFCSASLEDDANRFDACDPDFAMFCTSFDPAEDKDAMMSGHSPRSFLTTRAELLLDFCVVATQFTLKLDACLSLGERRCLPTP